MRPRTASRLAWSLFGAAVLLAGLALVFLILGRSTPPPSAPGPGTTIEGRIPVRVAEPVA